MSLALRVFVVIPDGTPTAAHRTTVELLAHLPAHDVEPVVCFLGDGPLCSVCRDDEGIETILVPIGGSAGAGAALDLVMRGARAGLVHSVSAGAHLVAGRAARRVGLRAVWSQFEFATLRRARDLRAALVPARAILTASASAEKHQRRVNPRRIPIATITPGIRRHEASREERRPRARAVLGLGGDELAVGWLVGADACAELEVALRAAASVCHARALARLVVIRSPAEPRAAEFGEAVASRAAALGIGSRFLFAPPHDRAAPNPALCALDLAFAAPPCEVPFALEPAEALAAGVPVVVSDVEPLRGYVDPGRDGLVVRPGDHEALAAALLSLCDAPDVRAEMELTAELEAWERFDARATAERVAATYRKAAER